MNESNIIAGIALLVSVASFFYSAYTARQGRRIKLLTYLTEFILMQERIEIVASRLSQLSSSNQDEEKWNDIANKKRQMAANVRDYYDELEKRKSMGINFLTSSEIGINNMLATAKCDLEWLQKVESDIHQAQNMTIKKSQD